MSAFFVLGLQHAYPYFMFMLGIETTVLKFTLLCKDFTHVSTFPAFKIHLKGDAILKKKINDEWIEMRVSEAKIVSGIMLTFMV